MYHCVQYTFFSLYLQDMLFRRTCLLVAYEDANRGLEKAKPAKRKAVGLETNYYYIGITLPSISLSICLVKCNSF